MKKITPIILLILLFLSAVLIVGCNKNGNNQNNTTETQSGETEDMTVRYRISKKDDYYIPLYDWYRKVQRSFDGKGQVYWNNTLAKKLNCNWINVFPSGKSKDGSASLPGAFLLDIDRIIKYTAKGLQESHENGIKIMTSAPIAEVWKDTWLDWGIDPTDMLTMDLSGKRIDTAKDNLVHACNNDPQWQHYLINYTERMAEAGFDGCLYDGYTYAYDPGYYCSCEDCKESWKNFCLELYGEEKPYPTKRDLAVNTDTEEIDRAYVVWRLKTQSDVYNALRAAGRKYVPDFEVYINSTIYDIAMTYFYINGLDVTSSEFKHKLGHENSSFMYIMHEALTDKQLISFTNVYTSQYQSINEYYVELMTAFANGGGMCQAEVSRTKEHDFYLTDVTKRLGEILTTETEKFSESGNIAGAAVLYSWRDTAYYQVKGFDEFRRLGGTNVRELYTNCASRRMAVNLARAGIPYSYIVAETNPSDDDLSYLDTIIIPELTLLDKSFEDQLLRFVQNGGNLIISGNEFGTTYSLDENAIKIETRDYDVLEKWTGTAYSKAAGYQEFSVGKGKIVVSKKYVTSLTTELDSHISDEMIKALDSTGVSSQVIIESQPKMGYINSAIRANASGTKLYLHLVNYDIGDDYQSDAYTVSTVIPDGATVTGVEVQSPFYADLNEIGLKWEVKDGRIYATGNFNIYSYLTITLAYN